VPKFVASSFVLKGTLSLYLDMELIIENNDSVVMELKDGVDYIVHWFVNAKAGNSFSITISSPLSAHYELMRTVNAAGKHFGWFQFRA
jgi:hypothetical protein